MSFITCCMNCTERTVGCHGSCERYNSQKEENQKKKQDLYDSTHSPVNLYTNGKIGKSLAKKIKKLQKRSRTCSH